MNYVGAPYNFIPLPEQVKTVESVPPFDKFHSDRYSGYFDCTLTTLTPLYIRSSLTSKEYQTKSNLREKKADDDKPDFFSPANKIRLPGSSLRGMIRTLVEIISQSELEFIGNQQLFFREVGSETDQSIACAYRKWMFFPEKNPHNDEKNRGATRANQQGNGIRAGVIKKEGSRYFIYPSGTNERSNIFRLHPETAAKILGLGNPRDIYWSRRPVWFLPNTEDRRMINEPHIRLRKFSEGKPPVDGWRKGWMVVPGREPPPRRDARRSSVKKHWVILEPELIKSNRLELDYDDVRAYRDGGGVTRDIAARRGGKSFSVLPETENEVIPCFYVEWKDTNYKERISFGHTAYFRLPYDASPKDLVKASNSGGYDFAKAIFGTASGEQKDKSKRGRVFFEDAELDRSFSAEKVLWDADAYPKVLSSPKPTTFQHYLDQSHANVGNEGERKRKLHHYSNKAKIRGFKLYWHRDGDKWVQTDREEVTRFATQYTRIRPVKPNVTFKFRIRFENLAAAEVGALAVSLNLPGTCAHKLGMGKPLGLGSVRIKADLQLIERKERYSRLFAPNTTAWNIGITEQNSVDFDKAFCDALQLSQPAYWQNTQVERICSLLAMLEYEKRPAYEDTRYMEIARKVGYDRPENEYKKRPILPYPLQVVGLPVSSVTNTPVAQNNIGASQQAGTISQIAQGLKKQIENLGADTRQQIGSLWQQTRKMTNEAEKRMLAEAIKQKLIDRGLWTSWADRPWVTELKECLGE